MEQNKLFSMKPIAVKSLIVFKKTPIKFKNLRCMCSFKRKRTNTKIGQRTKEIAFFLMLSLSDIKNIDS